ncbi:hypothetical protein [Methanocella paludicola]|uniref:hypothetical protein n=1 Tax=Methanocella paludicola TaxID=570267 RepID=UPI0010084B18|nr:hypothetical protein [Methanocella paludicola]
MFEVDNAVVAYVEVRRAIPGVVKEGNFGSWCIHEKNVFCQEREGCSNCCIALRDGAQMI